MTIEAQIKAAIREIPDFPKLGILFKDITTVFQDAALCNRISDEFVLRLKDTKIDAIAAIESRGFMFGFHLALMLGVPFIPIRKLGKLPSKTIQFAYNLEYGSSTIEMHKDAIKSGMNILIHDDLLATGGTATASAELVKMLNGKVTGFAFLVELEGLGGIGKIKAYTENIISLVNYN